FAAPPLINVRVLRYILLGLVVLLIGVRIALPFVLKSQINKKLAQSPDYNGKVRGVSVSLIKGAFELGNLDITDKQARGMRADFPRILLDISWSALLHKKILLTLDFNQPRIHVILQKAATEAEKAKEKAKQKVEEHAPAPKASFGETLRQLPHFRIDSVAIHDGQVELVDPESKPEQHIWLRAIDFGAFNLTNSKKISKSLYGSAEMNFHINE